MTAWRWIASAIIGMAVASLTPIANAQTPATGETIIQLSAKGSVPPLNVPEVWDRLKTGETMVYDVSEPTLQLYRPASGCANGTAVIVAPGGGLVPLGYTFGGTDIARALARHGVTAFVLKYRTIRSGDGPMRMPDIHMKEIGIVMSRAKTGEPIEMRASLASHMRLRTVRARLRSSASAHASGASILTRLASSDFQRAHILRPIWRSAPKRRGLILLA